MNTMIQSMCLGFESAAASGRWLLRRWLPRLALAGATTLLAAASRAETLRLASGEVLIGRIVERTEATITFESNALGRLSVPAVSVTIVAGADEAPAPPSTPSQAAVPAAPEPAAPPMSWMRKKLALPAAFSGSIELGADVLTTDVKMRDYIVEASFGWKDGKNEYQTYHAYEKVTVDGTQVTDTHDEGVRWIRHLHPRWMWLSQADWRHDASQGIDYRVDLVGVPAFYFFKSERFRLLGGVGPSYEWRQWDVPGAPLVDQFNVAAYEVMNFGLTSSLSLRQTFLGYVKPGSTDDYRYVFDVSLRHQLSAGLSLILSYNQRHESNPPPGGVEKQERFMTKLGYQF